MQEKWQNRQVVTSEIEAVREFGSAVLGRERPRMPRMTPAITDRLAVLV
jgi:hypothetical protein